jgi:two-component system, NarL family, nitrate/nitrite response regulator NarL
MHDHSDEKRLRLIVLSDQALFRTSLARFLASEGGLEVVCECSTGGEAIEYLKTSPVDLILLDPMVGGENAGDVIANARSAGFQGRFLIVAESAEGDQLARAFKLGASGIFRKSEAPERLVLAIRVVAAGAMWVDQNAIELLTVQPLEQANHLGNRRSGPRLEDREEKVIQGIMDGLTTRRIGEDLEVSEGSVKNILQGLFAKTGVRKRSQLVRLALEGSLGSRFTPNHVTAHSKGGSGGQSSD